MSNQEPKPTKSTDAPTLLTQQTESAKVCPVTKQAQPTNTMVDYVAIREELQHLMEAPEWDDGSYAPLLIRLAWHSSGSYCAADGSGGSNGSTMRHAVEAADPENAGLGKARELLEPIRKRHSAISVADLWILAAVVAIERTGGPKIPFTGGRVDASEAHHGFTGRLPGAEAGVPASTEVDAEGRIVGWEAIAQHVRDIFGRMGLSDREAVALLCGGHAYGRCHPENSGYNGAWIENPTRFSTEYAADMIGDEWMLVAHDTKMPDGQPVPEEVRPAPGKRQYINLSKYNEKGISAATRAAPEASEFKSGRYRCNVLWVNCRELPDTSSPIIGRLDRDQEINIVFVKVFGTAVRGCTDTGGWVSIVGSGGATLFERTGELKQENLVGNYRVVGEGAPTFKQLNGPEDKRLPSGTQLSIEEIAFTRDAIYGRCSSGDWALLFSPSRGLPLAERVVRGWNETPRRPIKGQTGHQMMLVADMVLLWDSGFRKHLEAYAESEQLLSEDFGKAFQRLTELGCPWSADRGVKSCQFAAFPAGGCPFLAMQNSK